MQHSEILALAVRNGLTPSDISPIIEEVFQVMCRKTKGYSLGAQLSVIIIALGEHHTFELVKDVIKDKERSCPQQSADA